MKEKVYTFRRFAYASALSDGAVSEDQIRDNLIETQLNNGYYPVDVKVEKIKANAQDKYGQLFYDTMSVTPTQEYLVATAKTAYAGKKMARELWNKNPNMTFPKTITLT